MSVWSGDHLYSIYVYVGGNVLADRSLNESSSVLLMYTNGLRST